MGQEQQSKEMSGNKMVKIIIGIILIASIIIVVAIQAFYMLWEPKEPKQIEQQNETEQPSYSKSAQNFYEELLYLG
ncbi:hypothetical protein [Solibacillus merdavium]|mgnify:FL=1|uniref:Uncharacterized protein n=1 Tax=Solibacillus merdavium TaxID=2762218 RepID=A0ABR8XP77_9BACL|nr:hypothetical protein [Solibacillus merdavium]MBD8033741.1 hypothetical protein [Solibacillus merdavium]